MKATTVLHRAREAATVSRLLIASSALCLNAAWAQATAPSAAPKPPAGSNSTRPATAAKPTGAPSAGGALAGQKLMTREELRVCLARNDELKVRSKELDDMAVTINAERPAIDRLMDEVRAERATIDSRASEIKAFEARMLDYRRRVDAFNARMSELGGNERRTRAENNEFQELRKQIPTLEAERTALTQDRERLVSGFEEIARAFTAKAKTAEERATDWNQRRARHTQDSRDITTAAADWQRECGDRPYREDDEKAIRAGK